MFVLGYGIIATEFIRRISYWTRWNPEYGGSCTGILDEFILNADGETKLRMPSAAYIPRKLPFYFA